ncbi:MAG TPA: DMT family transporter [Thermoguttaceae bacterium]|nr:DMT family transporter [Thermoguttaceae bacterium]HPP51946.1 DMT family transporter [Thermoguttaceae bacterium]
MSQDSKRDVFHRMWFRRNPAAWGSLLCFFSAVGYTATNMCLRQLAALGTDPMWATAMKETVAVVVLGPWFLLEVLRGRRFFPSVGWIGLAAVSALVAQFAGNIFQQWSFGVVGLAVAVPAIFSVSLTGGAILAWVFLKESVPLRTLGALGLLIGSIGVLSFGAVQADSLLPEAPGEKILLGIGAASAAGAAFAQLGLMLRMTSSKGIPPQGVVLLVTGVGAALLGPISLWRLGPDLLRHTSPEQWTYMAGAGVCNLLAFLAITTGLRWTKLVRANLLNAAQVAMGAAAGIVVFGESWNWAVAAGLALTLLGLWLMGTPKTEATALDDPAAEIL